MKQTLERWDMSAIAVPDGQAAAEHLKLCASAAAVAACCAATACAALSEPGTRCWGRCGVDGTAPTGLALRLPGGSPIIVWYVSVIARSAASRRHCSRGPLSCLHSIPGCIHNLEYTNMRQTLSNACFEIEKRQTGSMQVGTVW